MENNLSIFDEDIKNADITARSGKRRDAIKIPKKLGKEIVEKINEEIER